MIEKPVFIQGLFAFVGGGLSNPRPASPPAAYSVPGDKRAQTVYLRAGNPSGELICLVLTVDGVPTRYFPVGAKGTTHVPLAVVEDLAPDAKVEVLVAAPEGLSAAVVLDVGFMEID